MHKTAAAKPLIVSCVDTPTEVQLTPNMLSNRFFATIPGVLIVFLVATAIAHGLAPEHFPAWPAGLAAWCACAALWGQLSRSDRSQSIILAGLGVLGISIGAFYGEPVRWHTLLVRNEALLAMLAAVSFLRLICMPAGRDRAELPQGLGAFVKTLVGVHLFGATINMSAMFIIGDRLSAVRPMTFPTAVALSRAFTCGALYSPFFAAMGVVLLYVPDASFPALVSTGLPVAGFCFVYAVVAAWWKSPDHLASFSGYPVTIASLWVPFALAAGVMTVHATTPELSVLTIITVLAPSLVALALPWRNGRRHAIREVTSHVRTGLAQMGGLLALFLSAGVLATGIDAGLAVVNPWLPFERFEVTAAIATLIGMSVLAAIGLHPLILVAAIAAWLAPINPAPDLLAAVFLLAWGIGGALNPLSGTHIAMAARYGVANWRLPLANLVFAVLTVAFSFIVLTLFWRG